MYARSTIAIPRWILGKRCRIFQKLVGRPSTVPVSSGMVQCVLLRSFERLVLKACSKQNPEEKSQRLRHFEKDNIRRELRNWILQHPNCNSEEAKMINITVCVCILVRDFEKIRVEIRKQLGIEDGGGSEEPIQGVPVDTEIDCLKRKVAVLVEKFNVTLDSKWDCKTETWLNAFWTTRCLDMETEAKIVMCRHILQHQDSEKGILDFCKIVIAGNKDSKADKNYSAEHIRKWYVNERDNVSGEHERDMHIICDIWKMNAVPPGEPGEALRTSDMEDWTVVLKDVDISIMRVVACYLTQLLSSLDHSVMHEYIPVDRSWLALIQQIYEKICTGRASHQMHALELFNQNTRMQNRCLYFFRICHEIEVALHVFVCEEQKRGPDKTRQLMRDLLHAGAFCSKQDPHFSMQKWATMAFSAEEISENMSISIAIIQKNPASALECCLKCSGFLRSIRIVEHKIMLLDDDNQECDAGHLLDKNLFREEFDACDLITPQTDFFCG